MEGLNRFYKIVPYYEEMGKIFVSEDFEKIYLAGNVMHINVNAGSRKVKAEFISVLNQEENIIKLSKDLIDYLSIPLNLLYQIRGDKEGISLGPVIGILISMEKNKLTTKKIKRQMPYTLLYKKFKGLIYLFSWENINFEEGLIEGYCYKPEGSNSKDCFEKGTFPFPSVVYNRALLPRLKEKKLKNIVYNKMFNSCRFNKLEFCNIASSCDAVRKHIPETKLFLDINDIDGMLERYASVYLKPIKGTLAKGLIKVSKRENNYCFQINENPNPVLISDNIIAINYFNRIKFNQQYLVQQGINSLNFENRHTDFRVIMQKDEGLKWHCTAIIARLGKKEGICSNFIDSGYALTFEEVFLRFLKFKTEDIIHKKNELIDVCKKTCEMLDDTGENFGDVGIDVAIDKELNIWIIEVNNRHSHNIILPLKDETTFYKIKSNPIKYAVALSGFNIIDES